MKMRAFAQVIDPKEIWLNLSETAGAAAQAKA
jgi:hypothetical protein